MAGIMHVYGNGTNSTSGANTITHFYDRAGIKAANAKAIYAQFADNKTMPKKHGKTFKISRWQHIYDRDLTSAEFKKYGFLTSRSLEDVTTGLNNIKLAEGAGRGNLVNIKKVTLETSVSRYGEMIEYTDEVELFSEDAIQVRYREELGALANQRYEDLLQLDLLSTGNVMYAGVATNLGTMGQGIVANATLDDGYRVSYDLIRKAVQKLVRNRAKKNTTIVTGSTKVDTRTIAPAYYAVIGAEIKYDLENARRGEGASSEYVYIPAYKYGDASNLAEGEVGAMHEVRFIESESAMVYRGKGQTVPTGYSGTLSYTGTIGSGAKFDVFPILFPTEGSFATVGLKGEGKIKFNAQDPSKTSLDNPYGTKGFFSYNFWYGGIILKEEALLKVLVLATA